MISCAAGEFQYSASELLQVFDQYADAGNAVWLPPHARDKEFEDVPAEIAAAANEAHQCADVGAWRAAVLLARAVIEATAKTKGIATGRLINKIDAMYDARLIRKHIRDGAHEVRHLGNDMAHGDFVDAVTTEDGEFVLTLMGEVLDEVFQSPARVERRRLARTTTTHGDQGQLDG